MRDRIVANRGRLDLKFTKVLAPVGALAVAAERRTALNGVGQATFLAPNFVSGR